MGHPRTSNAKTQNGCSGWGAGETGLGAQALDGRGRIEFGGQTGQLFRGQQTQEALQDNLRLAQARAEIVVEIVELRPAIGGLDGCSPGNIAGRFVKLAVDLLESVGENAELVEKARAIAEQEMVEDCVPGGRALACIVAEKFPVQGLDGGNSCDTTAPRIERVAKTDERGGKASEQIGGDGNLLAGANQFAARAQR